MATEKTVFGRKLEALQIHAAWRWRAMRRHIRRERLRRQIEKADGPLAFRFNSPGNGLFAHLTWCLHVAGWAARHGRAYRVGCSSANYGDPAGQMDWFAQILEHRRPVDEGRVIVPFLVREFEELPFFTEASVFSLEDACELFRQSFRVAPPIAKRVEELKERLFQGRFVVGLHYRGTDKQLEAERIPYEDALQPARRALAAAEAATGALPALFLATDESALVEFAPRFLHPYPVVIVDSVARSTNGQPIHQDCGSDRSQFAVEAMTDALLLAECDLLLKTASMLSGWSVVMSSPKPVLMLSQPRPGRMFFPDYLIAETAYHPGDEEKAVAEAMCQRATPSLGRISPAKYDPMPGSERQ